MYITVMVLVLWRYLKYLWCRIRFSLEQVHLTEYSSISSHQQGLEISMFVSYLTLWVIVYVVKSPLKWTPTIVCSFWENIAAHWESMEGEVFLVWTDYNIILNRKLWVKSGSELRDRGHWGQGMQANMAVTLAMVVHFHVHFAFCTTFMKWT